MIELTLKDAEGVGSDPPFHKNINNQKTSRVYTMKFQDFSQLFMPEKMKKNFFGSVDPKCPENEKLMLNYAGGRIRPPLPTTRCVVMCETCIKRKSITSNFCFHEFF